MGTFQKAVKGQGHGRVSLLGPSGSGKSYWGLILSSLMAKAEEKRVAAVCSEHGALAKYADIFDFDLVTLQSYEPEQYMGAIAAAIKEGYGAILLDGISQAWAGKGGLLEFVDQEKKKDRHGDAFGAGWGKATPRHNAFIEAMLGCEDKIHLVVTMRTKMEFVKTEENGKTKIKKVGMQPIQRDGLEYEFDVVGDLEQGDNTLTISKSRCRALNLPPWNKLVPPEKAAEMATTYIAWLKTGVKPKPQPRPEPQPAAVQPEAAQASATAADDDSAGSNGPGYISQAERMALTGAAKAHGVSRDQFVTILKEMCGVAESAKIPKDKFIEVMKRLAPEESEALDKKSTKPEATAAA
jgi:hypothetical protein